MPTLPALAVTGEFLPESWGAAVRTFLGETSVGKATAIGQTPFVSAPGTITMLPAGAALAVKRVNAAAAAIEWSDIASNSAPATPALRTLGTNSFEAAPGNHTHDAFYSLVGHTHTGNKYTALWSNGGGTQITWHSSDGSPAALALGSGTAIPGNGGINVGAGMSLFKNGTAYTNPDYAFEHAFTGKVERFKDNVGAEGYPGLLPLREVEAFAREHFQLPNIARHNQTDDPCGVPLFRRADAALEVVEELYLHLFELARRITALGPPDPLKTAPGG